MKYYVTAGPGIAGQSYSCQIKVKNIGISNVCICSNQGNQEITVSPGEVKFVKLENIISNGSTQIQIQFRSQNISDSLDFYAFEPQIQQGPVCSQFYPPASELPAPPPPTDAEWTEITSQQDIDKLKLQDNAILSLTSTTNNMTKALLLEFDLSAVCNNLYGESNSSIRSAIKGITIDSWISGQSSNAGASIKLWNGTSNYYGSIGSNQLSTINKVSGSASDGSWITTLNKLYVLIAASYPYDGTTPSTLNIDYVSCSVDFARVYDNVSIRRTNIPLNRWAFVIKGLSPKWLISESVTKIALHMVCDNGSVILLHWHTGKQFRLASQVGTILYLKLPADEMESIPWISINLIVTKNEATYTLYALREGSSMVKKVADIEATAWPFGSATLNKYSEDAFYNSIEFYPNVVVDDALAERILRGTEPGFENPNIVDLSKITLHPHAVYENNLVTLNASSIDEESIMNNIYVFPNNLYKLSIEATEGAVTELEYYYGDYYLGAAKASSGTAGLIFRTPERCNKIKLQLSNGSNLGQFVWNKVEIRHHDGIEPVTPDTGEFKIDGAFMETTGDTIIIDRYDKAINPLSATNFSGSATIYQPNELVTVQAADKEV
jgi:hypothetical protein